MDQVLQTLPVAATNEQTVRRRNFFSGQVAAGIIDPAEYHKLKHRFPYFGLVECTHGNIVYSMFSANDDVVAWEYFWLGSYERDSVDAWLEMTKEADIVLDIGAYTGCMSMIAAVNNKDCIIHAFEPVLRTVERLAVKLKSNGLMSRVKVHSCGVSDTGKRIELYMPRDRDFLGTGNSIYNKPGIKNVDATVCDVVRLDDYFQVPEGRRVSCVKLDVEGHEFAAVTGMAGILKKHRPSLIVEVWPHESDSLKAFFGDLGYTWSVIDGMNWLFTP